jgi:Holliday junction DNA helicase RuvA
MIGWLKGVLQSRGTASIIINVGGVGYVVGVSGTTLADAPLGKEVEVHIYTHVREDTLALYGFESEVGLATFHLLISVSGVGPKLAVGLLGAISPGDLARAVEGSDTARLKSLPGVGKKLAERLSLELKGKLKAGDGDATAIARAPSAGVWPDLRSALANLQYRPKEVDRTLEILFQSHPDAGFDALFREAMKLMRR